MKGESFIAFINAEEGYYAHIKILADTSLIIASHAGEEETEEFEEEVPAYLCYSLNTRKVYKVEDIDFIEYVSDLSNEEVNIRLLALEQEFTNIVDTQAEKAQEIEKELRILVDLGYSHIEAVEIYKENQKSKSNTSK